MMMKRWLHLLHRWLGIALGLLILLWLLSGLVMLFVARPALQEGERLQALAPLPTTPPPVSAAQAWAALGIAGAPEALRLQQQLGRPVWLLQEAGKTWHAVDGLTGQPRAPLTEAQARALAIEQGGRLSGRTLSVAVAEVELQQRDQWSIYSRFNAQRPLYRVALAQGDGDEGLELYIGQRTGDLVLDTRTWERGWNWLGTVTHWLYFTPLRANGPLWRDVVLWSSGAALALVLLGLVLGLQRLRLRGRYASGSVSPYRERWQRWHHLLGLGAGLVLLSWLFSGWLSMAPWGWPGGERAAAGEQQRWRGGELQPASLSLPDALPEGVGELAALRLQGQHFWLASALAGTLLLDMQGQVLPQGLDEARLRAAAASLQPSARLVEVGWLHQPDLHYYALRHQTRAFPVYRVAFDDAAGSVYYLDPRTARVALRVDQAGRWNRWLFNALHRWDFPPLAASVLGRDLVVTGLSLLGAALSLTGCVLAWRRLQRSGRRNERKPL